MLFIASDPLVAFVPDQPSEAVQVVAFVDSQESVTDAPATTSAVPTELFAFSVIVTAPPPDPDEDDDEEDDDELLDDEDWFTHPCIVYGLPTAVPQ